MLYKIYMQSRNADFFSDFIENVRKTGDVLFYGGFIYVWVDKTAKGLKKILSNCDQGSYVCAQLKKEDVGDGTDFLTVWAREHYAEAEMRKIEDEHQPELMKMHENLTAIRAIMERVSLPTVETESSRAAENIQ